MKDEELREILKECAESAWSLGLQSASLETLHSDRNNRMTVDKAMQLIKADREAAVREAEDIAGLSERRQEVYQIWQWCTSKKNKQNVHGQCVYMLYRRFNDLTDQLNEITGGTQYVHYERDQHGAPIDFNQPTKEGE